MLSIKTIHPYDNKQQDKLKEWCGEMYQDVAVILWSGDGPTSLNPLPYVTISKYMGAKSHIFEDVFRNRNARLASPPPLV